MNNQQEKTLSEEQRRFLKKSAHHLKPVVQLGKKGISESLIKEVEQALAVHELIKVQLLPGQKAELDAHVVMLMKETHAEHIATIGNMIILFKAKEKDSAFF